MKYLKSEKDFTKNINTEFNGLGLSDTILFLSFWLPSLSAMRYDFIALLDIFLLFKGRNFKLNEIVLPVTIAQFIFAYTVYTFPFGFKYN